MLSAEIKTLIFYFNRYNCVPAAIPMCYVAHVLGPRRAKSTQTPGVLYVARDGSVGKACRDEVGNFRFITQLSY